MILAGMRTCSFVDYPKRICIVLYTAGCNFKCPWCHNWRIAYSDEYIPVSKGRILEKLIFLRKRLRAVCITGGEPTIHDDLPDLVSEIKGMKYLVKLDTNGTNPEMLYELIKEEMIDYVALDVKAKPENYEKLIGVHINCWDKISCSINILRNSSIEYEFRMTYVPGLSTEEDIEFFNKFLLDHEKGYITMARSTELFKVSERKNDIDFNKYEKIMIRSC